MEPARSAEWLYRYKRKIILSTLAVLTAAIVLTMVIIAGVLRSRLLEDSKMRTEELSEILELSLRDLMLERNPATIQDTLDVIGKNESGLGRILILDKNGKIAYSTPRIGIGTSINRFQEPSCKPCHSAQNSIRGQTTLILKVEGQDILRHVKVFLNEQACIRCHPASETINGMLVVDRSVQPTYSLIAHVELILALLGGLCLAVLVPLSSRMLSRGVDTYINEVMLRSTELAMLYNLVGRLSKTIDLEELKPIVIDAFREILDAEEIHVLLPKRDGGYGGVLWTRTDQKIQRRGAPPGDPYRPLAEEWLQGRFADVRVSDDKKEVFMPVASGDRRLALIILRKKDNPVDEMGVRMIKAVSSHLAVAFENAALYRQAITDELTGLFTRRHFQHILERNLARHEKYGEKLTLLMIDIDDFKKINDTFGHPAGDDILKNIASTISKSTRDQDFSFRYGGEEFSVLLPSTDTNEGEAIAERIRDIVERTTSATGGHDLKVTVSLGVASCPENARTLRALVAEADKALYEAKYSGKNRVAVSRAGSY